MRIDDRRERTVAVYARVSTEHEQQLYALDNQIDWYNDIFTRHANWDLREKYIDRGITGTSALKRPNFQRMIRDAQQGKFNLIVTREVSRFARNTVDTLQYVRQLKKINVEVYFVEDNIWSFDPDGELRLTIMASLAQDESRKTSVRVKAGQKISMEKGVFFQNGSILGYDKIGKEMVINEEQAKTVRMIFDMYNSGMGVRKIQWELEAAGRKTAKGKSKWDTGVISRILKNKFYCGKIVWYKQYVPDYLEQKRVNNHGEKEQFEVLGSHTPIVTEEEWERANATLMSKRISPDSTVTKKNPSDVWVKKMECSCGHKFNRVRWYVKKGTGEIQYGYQCYDRLRTGSVKTRLKKGLPIEGICETPEVAGWKLEAQALYIFRKFSVNKDELIQLAIESYQKHMGDGADSSQIESPESIQVKIERYEQKIENLIEMRTDGDITKVEFQKKKQEFELLIQKWRNELGKISSDAESAEYQEKINALKEMLDKDLEFSEAEYIPHYIIDTFVESIVVDRDVFKWRLYMQPDEISLKVDGRKNSHIATRVMACDDTGSYR